MVMKTLMKVSEIDADAKSSRCDSCKLDRRTLFKAAASSAGLIVLAEALSGCGNPTGTPPTGPVAAGNVSALSVGTLRVLSNVAVARDSEGVYAMSAVCTHQGCLLSDAGGSIVSGLGCPCHGSAFDGAGAVTRGPAQAALQHYAVSIASDGSMTVDGSQPVSTATRTTVS
jgi:Rieske Fe-S protein